MTADSAQPRMLPDLSRWWVGGWVGVWVGSGNGTTACTCITLNLDNRASNLLLADSGCGLPPDAHSACAEVRVAPSKRPRDEN